MWIVEKDAIKQIKASEITDSEVGLKALGLCRMPAMWTLPFFVISSDFYNDINKAVDKRKEAEKYRENINTVINKMGMSGKKIIRSSGTKEGMEERGKYDSEIASEMDDIISKLIELVNKLSEYNELDSNGMPFIIQSFLEADIIGHISNERRFSEEKRDFIFEYKQYLLGNKKDERFSQVETGKVPLRNWREKIDIEQYTNTKLRYDSNKLREVLKIVCTFFLQKKERVHLEFVCDDSTFYLVQCDYQKKAKHITNPEEYDIAVYKERKEFYPKVLRRIQDEDKGKYKKIDNVFVYKELGIELPSLYLLDDPSTLSKLEEGIVSKDLQDDLEYMCKYSVVIRTDLKWEKSEESQLLKRSNEIKVYSEAEDFLLKTSKKLRETGKSNYGFILHNFIPARIAAFVNAKPLEESVEIQALWGLPEGLYYNSYDRIIIHTKTINISKMDQEKFKIIREEKYKEKFIAPDKNGKWVVKKLGEPYDWRCTIKDDQILKDIAYNARRIAEKVNEELSIMWFVDIDEQFYHANNIPWYHEKLARQGYYHPDKESRYKKKYFYEKEMVVKTREDLNKIENTRSSDVGIVRIQPKDDSLLRSRSFICELGRVCKEKGVSIFLEGSVLTHTFYQLKSTGATVLTSYESKKYDEKIEYNKLVRDKIPEIILQNGERATSVVIEGIGLLREIKKKIIEETYEVLEAEDTSDVLEELADLKEICMTFKGKCNLLSKDKCIQNFECYSERATAVFNVAVFQNVKQSCLLEIAGKMILVTFEREKGNWSRLDFILGEKENPVKIPANKDCFFENKDKLQLLELAGEIFFSTEIEDCTKKIQEIIDVIYNICQKKKISIEELEEKRLRKKEKKGGFDKGFILKDTAIKYEKYDDFLGVKNAQTIAHETEIEEKSNVDVDTLKDGRFLVRVKAPIYAIKNEWNINNKKIRNYFGEGVNIKIVRTIEKTRINIYFIIKKDDYIQLKLNL